LSETARIRSAWALAGYLLAAVIACMALSWLAARITAAELLDQAGLQRSKVQSGLPLWRWQLRRSHDLIAGKAFGNATIERDDDALRVTSQDGTPFELGLPVAWSLDLRHWPILEAQLQSTAAGTLGLVWQGSQVPACLAPTARALAPATRTVRIDLRALNWRSAGGAECMAPGIAQMLRLRIQLPAHASLRLSSVALMTTEPMPDPRSVSFDLPVTATANDLGAASERVQSEPMPLFRLPAGASAERMLALRDQLRARWPGALIVPASATPTAMSTASAPFAATWAGCALYLFVLMWLVWRPLHGPLRPWLELAGCLLGPLWLVAGLHWGLRPTPVGVAAFGGGLAYALAIERHHLPRLWRLPATGWAWLWPLAMLPVTGALILFHGHALRPLSPVHVLAYFGWAWLQQWLMLVVLLPRLEHILHRPAWAIVPLALVFALLHTPNGMLMQLCFIGELWWAGCFLRARSVLPIALAHATCALLVESGLTGGLLRSLEVSARFFL